MVWRQPSVLGFVRRYAEAVAPLETLLRLEPDNVNAWRLASLVYQQTKQDGPSFRATRRAAELGDTPSMFWLRLTSTPLT